MAKTAPEPITLEEWLQERLENAKLIAESKTGADRAGWLEDAAYLEQAIATARRGVEAAVCPDCKNTFQQPFKCVTCGAQKLYDATLLAAQQRAETAEADRDAKDRQLASCYDRMCNAEAALAEAVRREAELAEECADAWESAVDWGAYASEYFQEKWNLAADKERLTKACERVDAIRARNDQPAASPAPPCVDGCLVAEARGVQYLCDNGQCAYQEKSNGN